MLHKWYCVGLRAGSIQVNLSAEGRLPKTATFVRRRDRTLQRRHRVGLLAASRQANLSVRDACRRPQHSSGAETGRYKRQRPSVGSSIIGYLDLARYDIGLDLFDPVDHVLRYQVLVILIQGIAYAV